MGRLLTYLKASGVLKEPNFRTISARRPKQKRPRAVRKPEDYKIKSPGDLVEVDALDVRPLPGITVKPYNYVRPHQALNWMAPAEHLTGCHPELTSTASTCAV